MQLKHLEYFIQVVQCGSISKAATALYLKPSNLSKCMNNMEEEFGATLFNRSSKGVTLTSDGELILDWAARFVDEQQKLKQRFALRQQLAAQMQGNLNISIPATINGQIHADVLNAFGQTYPQICLDVEEMSLGDAIEAIQNKTSQAAVLIMNEATAKAIDDCETLIFVSTGKSRLAAYVAKDSVFAQKYHSISIKTLLTLPVLLYTPASTRISTISELLAGYGKLNVANQTSNVMLFHALLATGKYLAIGIEAYSGMENYTAIPIRDKLDLQTGFLFNRSEWVNPLLQLFIIFYLKFLHLPVPDCLAQKE